MVFRGKGKGKHTGSGKPEASADHANLTSVEDYDYYDEDMDGSAHAYQAHNDPVDLGSDDGQEALDHDDDEENDTFSSHVALGDVTVVRAAEVDAIALRKNLTRTARMTTQQHLSSQAQKVAMCFILNVYMASQNVPLPTEPAGQTPLTPEASTASTAVDTGTEGIFDVHAMSDNDVPCLSETDDRSGWNTKFKSGNAPWYALWNCFPRLSETMEKSVPANIASIAELVLILFRV